MEAQRIQVKLFFAGGARPEPRATVALFHRIIQERLLDGLLIDVTDYGHVHHGPGVMLIGHEANVATDEEGGRPGVLFARKREVAGSFAERLASAARSALAAAQQVEQGLGLPIDAGELLVRLNDRLLAPDDDASIAAARPGLDALGARLWAGAPTETMRVGADGRLAVTLRCRAPADVATLLARLS